jgi:CubicO group peptidase (beta-lactamase class C family)
MKNFQFITFCFFLILLYSCTAEATQDRQENSEEMSIDSTAWYDSAYAPLKFTIDTFFRSRSANGLFNGNVLIAEKGHVILHNSYGFTSPAQEDSLRTDHQFQLASVSKPFTATAILLLYDRGKLSLEDSIQQYIDSFPYPGIKLKHLLSHRGGLTNYLYFCDENRKELNTPVTNDEVIGLLCTCKPKTYYSPDQKFDYSNTGFMLLASIVEKISGQKFERFMQEEIFKPLGMNSSFIYNKNRDTTTVSMLNGYDYKGRLIENNYLNGAVGDKGMYSTVFDLYLFDEAIRNGKLLKKETWELAFAPRNPDRATDGKDDYGYGWRLKTSFSGYEIVYHTGWWKGFRSYFFKNRTLDQTIILLDNYKRNRFLSIEELLDLIDGGTFGSENNFEEEI